MTLDDILASLFPDGHDVRNDGGVLSGSGTLRSGGRALVIGVADRTALGVDEAIRLSGLCAGSVEQRQRPDPRARRQRQPAHEQARRASGPERVPGPSRQVPASMPTCMAGRPSASLRPLAPPAPSSRRRWQPACWSALPGADPAVMDLPSMAKVTKLSIDVLEEKAKSTPVFAPGLRNLAQTGAVHVIWDEYVPLADQLEALLGTCRTRGDRRDALGKERGGRLKAARYRGARP